MNAKPPDGADAQSADRRRTQAALGALTRWLMSDAVLRPSGSGAGVANWLWPDGMHDGLYPEICGYYLQFLALAAAPAAGPESSADGTVAANAAHHAASQVVRWLEEVGPEGNPPTLYHRDPTQSDWRSQCLFAFDLGMIYRGLAAMEARWPGIIEPGIMLRYRASIRSLIGDRGLASHSLRAGATAAEIPQKWSTQIDVHHVKIVAALAGVDPGFETAVAKTIADQAEFLARDGSARMRELHPFLYFVEGWLMLWGQSGEAVHLDRAATAFDIVLGEFDPDRAGGCLPPIAGRTDLATRSDVLAQALRAGIVLEHAGRLASPASPWPRIRGVLEGEVLSRVTPEGALEFDRVGRHRNIWASLFAWQALRLATQAWTGSLDARAAAASLI